MLSYDASASDDALEEEQDLEGLAADNDDHSNNDGSNGSSNDGDDTSIGGMIRDYIENRNPLEVAMGDATPQPQRRHPMIARILCLPIVVPLLLLVMFLFLLFCAFPLFLFLCIATALYYCCTTNPMSPRLLWMALWHEEDDLSLFNNNGNNHTESASRPTPEEIQLGVIQRVLLQKISPDNKDDDDDDDSPKTTWRQQVDPTTGQLYIYTPKLTLVFSEPDLKGSSASPPSSSAPAEELNHVLTDHTNSSEEAKEECQTESTNSGDETKNASDSHKSAVHVQDEPDEPHHPHDWEVGGEAHRGISCDICLVDYEAGDVVAWSKNRHCDHAFHLQCITEWLARKSTCPFCRHEYLETNDDSESEKPATSS